MYHVPTKHPVELPFQLQFEMPIHMWDYLIYSICNTCGTKEGSKQACQNGCSENRSFKRVLHATVAMQAKEPILTESVKTNVEIMCIINRIYIVLQLKLHFTYLLRFYIVEYSFAIRPAR
jgi:hypothetical protein